MPRPPLASYTPLKRDGSAELGAMSLRALLHGRQPGLGGREGDGLRSRDSRADHGRALAGS
jgi:hypothetical protein